MHMVQLMPLTPHRLCFSKTQNVLSFWYTGLPRLSKKRSYCERVVVVVVAVVVVVIVVMVTDIAVSSTDRHLTTVQAVSALPYAVATIVFVLLLLVVVAAASYVTAARS